jgi:hypothetical protein
MAYCKDTVYSFPAQRIYFYLSLNFPLNSQMCSFRTLVPGKISLYPLMASKKTFMTERQVEEHFIP